MAKMFPHALVPGEQTESERAVFDSINEELGSDWIAFHSVGWAKCTPTAGLKQGEIDFVVAHPQMGIVAIEVKGLGVTCRNGSWFRFDGKVDKPTKDPFTQALDHQFDLRRIIQETPDLAATSPAITHCVIFPFTPTPLDGLPPSADHGFAMFRDEFRSDFEVAFQSIVQRGLAAAQGDSPLGDHGLTALQKRLAPSLGLDQTLGEVVTDSIADLIALTHQQDQVLNNMAGTLRAAITGFAGSGKTFLAIEQAKRFARNGSRTLFICFNRSLAEELTRKNSELKNIEFSTFHSLGMSLLARAKESVAPPSPNAGAEAASEFWEHDLPKRVKALFDDGKMEPRFDALVVDEAQDLSTLMLEALQASLLDPVLSPIWLFLDDNQAIFRNNLEIGPEFARTALTINCRNTRSIHQALIPLYKGSVKPHPAGPMGQEVEWIESDEQAAEVLAAITRLRQAGVPTQDIVVLAPRPLRSSPGRSKGSRVGRELSASEQETNLTFTEGRVTDFDTIRFESIKSYKGLESPVVIICEWEDRGAHGAEDENAYVALSRASAHCIVIGAKGALASTQTVDG